MNEITKLAIEEYENHLIEEEKCSVTITEIKSVFECIRNTKITRNNTK